MGRLKDVIIIQGEKHYAQDIELTVQESHSALQLNCGTAFIVEFNEKKRLVIIQEVKRNYLGRLNINQVMENIFQAVAAEHDLEVYTIVLIKTGSMPKTSSSKIRRHTCRAQFLTGSLSVVGDWSENPRHKAKFKHLQTDVESLIEKLQIHK